MKNISIPALSNERKHPDEHAALGLTEVAERLSLGLSKTKELVASGAIRSLRVGRRVLVRPESITEFLNKIERGA